MARRGRRDRGHKVRMACRARRASTRDELFVPRARPSTFGHRDAQSEANPSILEIYRSRLPFPLLAPRPQVRDNSRGERVASEPWPPGAGGLYQDLVDKMALLHRKTVLHRDSR